MTVLEASAGTGKTYTIAALAARYVAEGTPLDRLLLVTFTRMATGELRDRVRERLVSAEQGLDRALAGGAPTTRDEVVAAARRRAAGARCGTRRDRLARALADFDAATIATTHGFCQEVLGGLGIAGDVERDARVRRGRRRPASTRSSTTSTCAASTRGDAPPFNRARGAADRARSRSTNPAAPIEPEARPRTRRRRCAAGSPSAVREELERRKRRDWR